MSVEDVTFSDKQIRYIQRRAAGVPVRQAAREAGYRSTGAGTITEYNPAILRAIQHEQTRRLTEELAPLALDTLRSVMTNEKAPAAARVQAAKVVLDKAGVGIAASSDAKEPHEMDGHELARAIAKLTAEIEERTRPKIEGQAVEIEPDGDIFA